MTQVIETDEAGQLVLSPELLNGVKPHTRFTIEATGSALIVQPEKTPIQRHEVYEGWKREWDALTEQISASWNTNKSAAEIIAEMRR